MDRLCDQARSAMKLVAVLALVLAWLFTTYAPPFVERVQALLRTLEQSTPTSRGVQIAALLNAATVANQHQDLNQLPLDLLRSLGRSELRALSFPESPSLPPPRCRLIDKSPCDDVTQERLAYRPSTGLIAIAQYEGIAADISRLDLDVVTIHQADSKLRTTVNLPIVDERVNVVRAYWTIGVITLAPMIFLWSLSSTILIVRSKDPNQVVVDWLPVHPGRVAQLLGGVWVWAPTVLMIIGMVFFPRRFVSSFRDFGAAAILILIHGVVAAAVMSRVTRIRRENTAALV